MGLSRRLAAYAVRRSHALLVEVPGWWATRVHAERDLLRRGWQLALSPADADVLVLCGEPGARFAQAVERVWDQLPGPRACVTVTGTDVSGVLDGAAARLADLDGQRNDARGRRNAVGGPDDGGTGDDEMAPAGIPLAGGGDDRDGLEMDVLHLPLGPVLPHWPPGLVLRCVLHGDVVAEACVEVLAGAGPLRPPVASALPALGTAGRCDGASRLLAVAGWDGAAAAARAARDLVLDGHHDQALGQLDRLRSRVARSWSLRWLLRGLGALDDDALRRHGLPVEARGDVLDRLVAMLDAARADPGGRRPPGGPDADAVLTALPELVAGLELAAVRLVVASLDPDTAAAAQRERTRA